MKIPTRPAPSVPRGEPAHENYYHANPRRQVHLPKKKPPPRPPPPKFNHSLLNGLSHSDEQCSSNSNKPCSFQQPLGKKQDFTTSLIDLSSTPPDNDFTFTKNSNSFAVGNSSFFGNDSVNYLDLSNGISQLTVTDKPQKTSAPTPTIIRAQPKGKFVINDVNRSDLESNNYSPPMPTIPPPSPPKCLIDEQTVVDDVTPHGIALYNYFPTHKDDLPIQVNDVVLLLRQINDEWLYGKIGSYEGMFPANFVDIRVPLPSTGSELVTALYEFNPETPEDLKLVPGQKVKVIKRVSNEWLYGESNGLYGQFPANFIDYIPANI